MEDLLCNKNVVCDKSLCHKSRLSLRNQRRENTFKAIAEDLGENLITYVIQTYRAKLRHITWSVSFWDKAYVCLV